MRECEARMKNLALDTQAREQSLNEDSGVKSSRVPWFSRDYRFDDSPPSILRIAWIAAFQSARLAQILGREFSRSWFSWMAMPVCPGNKGCQR